MNGPGRNSPEIGEILASACRRNPSESLEGLHQVPHGLALVPSMVSGIRKTLDKNTLGDGMAGTSVSARPPFRDLRRKLAD